MIRQLLTWPAITAGKLLDRLVYWAMFRNGGHGPLDGNG